MKDNVIHVDFGYGFIFEPEDGGDGFVILPANDNLPGKRQD